MFEVKKQFRVPGSQLKGWYSKNISERNQLNNQAIDKILLSWDEMLDNIPVRKLRPFHDKTHIVFFHIPKTAGTTLDFVVSKNLAIWGIFKQHGTDFDKNVAAFFKAGVVPKTIMGHNELSEYYYQLLDREKMIHITTIREPVARVVSYYDFLRAQPSHPSHKLASSMSLEEFVASPESDEVNNAQSFRLLGLLKNNEFKKDKRSVQELSDDAIYQLINRFTMFGLTERFDDFLLMLSQSMTWWDVYYQRKNVTRKKLKTDVSALPNSTIELIKDRNQVDINLYDKATIEFNKRCEELNITAEKVDFFKQNNQKFNQMVMGNKKQFRE